MTLKFVMCLLGFILSRYAAQYEFHEYQSSMIRFTLEVYLTIIDF